MAKFAAFLILAFLCRNALSFHEDSGKFEPLILEGTINDTIQTLLSTLPNPLVIEDTISLNLADNDILSGSIDLSDTSITGLFFQVPALNFAVIGMRFNFTFIFNGTLQIDSDYLADTLVLTVLPIYGNGSAGIGIDGLELMGSTQFNFTGGIQLQDFRIQIKLASLNVNLNGLLYDEDFSMLATGLINTLANDLIIPYIDENADAVSDAISPLIQDIINGVLVPATTTPPETTTTAPPQTTTTAPPQTTTTAPPQTTTPAPPQTTTTAPPQTTTTAPPETTTTATTPATLERILKYLRNV